MANYLKAVCECKGSSETNLVVVEDVNTLMSFVYFMKERWGLNKLRGKGTGWAFIESILLAVTGGFWVGWILASWTMNEDYRIGGYLLCTNCGKNLEKSAFRDSPGEVIVTSEPKKAADTGMTSELREAAELHSKGVLSDEEFQTLKARILQ